MCLYLTWLIPALYNILNNQRYTIEITAYRKPRPNLKFAIAVSEFFPLLIACSPQSATSDLRNTPVALKHMQTPNSTTANLILSESPSTPQFNKMSNYMSETQLDLDPDFKSFFQDFYATSDTPDAHEHYVKYFTDDATLIMASKKVQGSEGHLTKPYTPHPHPAY
jgi:hypothetical protein